MDDKGSESSLEALLRAFDNDKAFLREAFGMFLEDYPAMMDDIQQSITDRNATELRRGAHSLKGMVGNFQAAEAHRAASRLEEMGRQGRFDGAEEAWRELQTAMAALVKEIEKMSGGE